MPEYIKEYYVETMLYLQNALFSLKWIEKEDSIVIDSSKEALLKYLYIYANEDYSNLYREELYNPEYWERKIVNKIDESLVKTLHCILN